MMSLTGFFLIEKMVFLMYYKLYEKDNCFGVEDWNYGKKQYRS